MNAEHLDDSMIMVEANLDDMPGEWMGFVLEHIFEKGARDAFFTPIIMKKGRPAYKLSALIASEQLDSVKSFLFRETTTLGVRYYPVTCHRLEREFHKISLPNIGEVVVKVGKHNGEIVQAAPEYEDCARVAKKAGLPLKSIYELAKREAEKLKPFQV